MELVDSKSAFILANGDPTTIIRSSGNVHTTSRIMAMKRRTGFFSINYLREALFVPTSGVQRGDLVQNDTTGEQFFVEGYQTKTRGNTVVSINCELYAVNYPALQFSRIQKGYDSKLDPTGTTWPVIATAPANAEHVQGSTSYKYGLLLGTTVYKITMQTLVTLQKQDRVVIDGKPYKVDDINLSIIPGLQIIQVSVDERS